MAIFSFVFPHRAQSVMRTAPRHRHATHVPFPDCDHAHIQKVSEVWRHAVAGGPNSCVAPKKAKAYQQTVPRPNTANFASQFAPPVRRSVRCQRHCICISLLCLAALFFMADALLRYAQPGSELRRLGCTCLLVLLITLLQGVHRLLQSLYAKRQQERFARATRSWHQALQQWDKLVYCSCCSSVTDLLSGEQIPASELQAHLNAEVDRRKSLRVLRIDTWLRYVTFP